MALLIPVALVLLLCNLAEEDAPDMYGGGRFGPHFSTGYYAWQGWPYACVQRTALGDVTGNHLSTWRIWKNVVEFRPLAAMANLGIAILLLAFAGIGSEAWLRRRGTTSWWSVRLVDVMIAFAVVSIGLAIVAWHYREHRRELAIAKRLLREDYPPSIWWQSERLSWNRHLRSMLGIRSFDRAVEVSVVESEHIRDVAELRMVKSIDLVYGTTNSQLAQLERLEGLEALVMIDVRHYPMDPAEPPIQLPYLPNLRGLNLWGANFDGEGLDNVPSLEHFEAADTLLDDGDIEALSRLKRLKQLRVWGCKFSPEGIARLRAALPECEIAWEEP